MRQRRASGTTLRFRAWATFELRREACSVRPQPHLKAHTFHNELGLALAAVGHDLVATPILQGHFREDENVTLSILLEAEPPLVRILPCHLHAIFHPGWRGHEGGSEGSTQPWVWISEGESGARETVLSRGQESEAREERLRLAESS